MSTSYTVSETFSIVHARHISSRVAADMRLMSRYYGYPSESAIEDHLEEIAQLLAKGYLATFEIGFKREGRRLFTLHYAVRADGSLADSRAGGVPVGINITGATPLNFLTHSAAWFRLDQAERDAFEASLPIQRTFGEAPVDGDGIWIRDERAYAAAGMGLTRGRFVPQ
jgi:Bacterial HORMA domain family 1